MNPNLKPFQISDTNNKIINEYIKYYTNIKPYTSPETIRNTKNAIKKLADHLKNKSLKNASENDLMSFFKSINNPKSKESYAVKIIPFYRWIYNTPKRNRPKILNWFEYPTKREKQRLKNPNIKESLLITDEEYFQITNFSNDIYGQLKALWETYYLTGIRPSELPPLKIKDITTKNNICLLTIRNSKTIPRIIPFPESPFRLYEYLENHPQKNNPESPLFFSFKSGTTLTHIDLSTIRRRFSDMKKALKLKPTLKLKSFRKTRTSKVFYENQLTDKDIGKIFGWNPKTVIERRNEYELSDINDLIKKYCSKEYQSQQSFTQQIKQQTKYDNKTIEENKKLKDEIQILKYSIELLAETQQKTFEYIKKHDNKIFEKLSNKDLIKALSEISNIDLKNLQKKLKKSNHP